MKKLVFPPSEALYPVPVVLVTSTDKRNTTANIITIAWCGIVCSVPPLLSVSIRPERYSHNLIKETGDFAINIPTADILKATDLCGARSGRDIDKFKAFSLTRIPSSKISAPIIKECPVNIECRLVNTLSLGTHDMFIGKVVAVNVDEDIVDEKGKIYYEKAGPFVYTQGEYWSLGKKIGRYGFAAANIKA